MGFQLEAVHGGRALKAPGVLPREIHQAYQYQETSSLPSRTEVLHRIREILPVLKTPPPSLPVRPGLIMLEAFQHLLPASLWEWSRQKELRRIVPQIENMFLSALQWPTGQTKKSALIRQSTGQGQSGKILDFKIRICKKTPAMD